GVAIAVAVPNVLFCLFVIGYACRVLEVRVRRYLAASWLAPLVAASVPAAVWGFATPVEPTWPAIALGVGVGVVPYGVIVGVVELPPRWATLRRSVRRAAPRSAIAVPRP